MKIIVLGGSGFIGSHVCEKLAAAGHQITVPTRRRSNARHLMSLPRLDLLECNVHDAAQLASAVAGHDAVVNLVAVLHGDAARFDHVHVELPRKIVAACQAAGVQRLVHVSALGAAPDAPSMYLRSKAQGEAVLSDSTLSLTLLRPSVVFGAEDKLLNVFAKLQQIAPFVPLAGADAKFQPVWVEDVATAITQLVTGYYQNNSYSRDIPLDRSPETLQKQPVYELCGQHVLSLRDLFALAGRCAGVQRPIVPLPMSMARLQAWVMEHLPGEPLMSRDNLDSMRSPNIASGKLPGLAALGIEPGSIYAIVPTYIGAARRMDQYRRGVGGR